MDLFDLFWPVKSNLAGGHGSLFVEIAPWSINYCDIVFLVAYTSVKS